MRSAADRVLEAISVSGGSFCFSSYVVLSDPAVNGDGPFELPRELIRTCHMAQLYLACQFIIATVRRCLVPEGDLLQREAAEYQR